MFTALVLAPFVAIVISVALCVNIMPAPATSVLNSKSPAVSCLNTAEPAPKFDALVTIPNPAIDQ
jgi:hypothetical protein